uniref:Protein kinase domain-containing protein n=1 Tax=Chrysotila carterae TaxID=13221 RepID=A0A7S4F9Z7_CHRCT|mmetsp:Transcript_11486/g.24795  ORF Transcript_11486/g.24795 Transcript_11486/m.24795 type:complete len:444 (+) Transcript_11486:235-1566(+)
MLFFAKSRASSPFHKGERREVQAPKPIVKLSLEAQLPFEVLLECLSQLDFWMLRVVKRVSKDWCILARYTLKSPVWQARNQLCFTPDNFLPMLPYDAPGKTVSVQGYCSVMRNAEACTPSPGASVQRGPIWVSVVARSKGADDVDSLRSIRREMRILSHFQQCQLTPALHCLVQPSMSELNRGWREVSLVTDQHNMTLGALLATTGSLSHDYTLWFTWQLLQGLCVLHASNVAHRSLHPDAILISRHSLRLMIADFASTGSCDGVSVVPDTNGGPWKGSAAQQQEATHYCTSPEALLGQPVGAAADVWAVGCIIAELASSPRRPFFEGCTSVQQLRRRCSWLKGTSDNELARLMPDGERRTLSMLRAMLVPSPRKRVSATAAVEMCPALEEFRIEFELPHEPYVPAFDWHAEHLSPAALADEDLLRRDIFVHAAPDVKQEKVQ